MGTNVKCLIALKGSFWRQAELAPDMLTDGPVHLTWDATDGQAGPGAAMVAFSGGNAADACREWTPATRIENYMAALEKVYRGIRPSFVKARFMDWPGDPWSKGVVLVPGAGPGRRPGTDAAAAASAGCSLPASTPATRSWATWKARSSPARPQPGASRSRDGVAKAGAA